MRVFGQLALVLCVCGTVVGAQAPDERAAKVLADVRAALGGEARLSAVRNLSTTGRTRRVQGDNLVPIEFEILVELPDKYLRKDEIPAQESDPTTTGFNGEALLQIPPPVPPEPRPGMPAPPPGQFENMLKQRAVTARQDFARLMLGMFATSFKAFPLTFKYAGQAEAPQGKAYVLEATGENNFKIRFLVHVETSLPIMVSWTAPARAMPPGRGAPSVPPGAPVAPGTPGGRPAPSGTPVTPPAPPGTPPPAPVTPQGGPPRDPSAAPPAGPPEQRLYFADYREVDGIKLPFRLRRAVGTNTTEETTFDRFRINQKVDPRRFEVRK